MSYSFYSTGTPQDVAGELAQLNFDPEVRDFIAARVRRIGDAPNRSASYLNGVRVEACGHDGGSHEIKIAEVHLAPYAPRPFPTEATPERETILFKREPAPEPLSGPV